MPSLELSNGWSVRRADDTAQDAWLPVQKVPSEVHLDLEANGKISDPFVDLNELSARWVAEHAWVYRTSFATPAGHEGDGVVSDLVFQGLDTFATVSLNGTKILQSDNMFIEHRINVSTLLKPGGGDAANELEIVFESARLRGLELVKQHPEHWFIVHQTEVTRGPVRKAQYQWGWDWGPILLTCGPWKPVLLETYTARIEEVSFQYMFPNGLDSAVVAVSVKVQGSSPGRVEVQLSQGGHALHSQAVDVAAASTDPAGVQAADVRFTVSNPKLWWPRGYGQQDTYELRVSLLQQDGTAVLAEQTKRVGFRSVKLIQEKDESGQSFYFRVNGVDMFAGGSCWIPADNYLSRITPDSYREWVRLIADGNQAMIRVWGGGIYETAAFYDACDELGVLVWQDFAFACANYPAYPDYLKSVETEARQNVKRLHHHPSLIIWAGNNEDYQIVERYGLEYKFEEDKDPQSWLKTNFPARYLYEHLLPKIVAEDSPWSGESASKPGDEDTQMGDDTTSGGMIYHPSSPWGNGTSTTLKVDPKVGDIHQWNVWHGDMHPYQNLPVMGGRFVSEFGMEAYPHLSTLEGCVTDPAQRYPGSMVMDFHNKAIGHERRLITYVAENFRIKYDMPSFTHLTQVMQADAMTWAYRSWRRDWGVAGKRKSGGALVWQLNDCWPTVSWAVVDYYRVRKPAYYAIQRALAPLAVGVTRKVHSWTLRPADELWKRDTGHVDPTQIYKNVTFDAWVASSRLKEVKGEVVARFISISTGKEVAERVSKSVTIGANGTTEVISSFTVDPQAASKGNELREEPFVIHVSLHLEGEAQPVSTDVSWPEPIKYLDLSDRGLKVEEVQATAHQGGTDIEISVEKPVKGFVIAEKPGLQLSDNGFDLVPGEKKTIKVDGSRLEQLLWAYVGQ